MYEIFTDRARKVMQFANMESLNLNHDYVGTEHVLLGLLKEGSGVAGHVLHSFDLSVFKIKEEIEEINKTGDFLSKTDKLPLSPGVQKLIQNSIKEAKNLKHNYVGTEHLLLGILKGKNLAMQILINLGIKVDDVKNEVLLLVAPKNKEKIKLEITEKLFEIKNLLEKL